MDYLALAFGTWEPQEDEHAAVKFCLNSVLVEGRFDELAQLLSDSPKVSGFGGDPGWFLETRSDTDPECLRWPEEVSFHALVDPDGYELRHPEGFYTRRDFSRYVRQAIDAYANANPASRSRLQVILRLTPTVL